MDNFHHRARLAALGTALALVASLAAAASAPAATAPNGMIAYQCVTESFDFDICVVDPATGTVRNLTSDTASDGFPSWSPDGTQIAFNSDYEIAVMNADGSGRRHLIGGYDDFVSSPAWSPDGSRIAFFSTRGETDYEIWTVPAGGETPASPAVRLTTTPRDEWGRGQHDFEPAWSPDSKRLVFVSQSRDLVDACDVYAMDATDADGDGNGDNLLRLTYDNSYNCSAWEDVNPAWSPTGELIAYSSVRSGDAEIWVMRPDGSGQRNITNDPAWDWMPGWSPDGLQVTFTSARDAEGDEEIYAMPVSAAPAATATARTAAAAAPTATAGLTQLTHNDTQDRMSEWGAAVSTRPSATITSPKHGANLRSSVFTTIKGTAAAGSRKVVMVQVGLRQNRSDGSCRWWDGSQFVVQGCASKRWIRAAGTTSWSYGLSTALPPTRLGVRSYTVFARATDGGGLPTNTFTPGVNANTISVAAT